MSIHINGIGEPAGVEAWDNAPPRGHLPIGGSVNALLQWWYAGFETLVVVVVEGELHVASDPSLVEVEP